MAGQATVLPRVNAILDARLDGRTIADLEQAAGMNAGELQRFLDPANDKCPHLDAVGAFAEQLGCSANDIFQAFRYDLGHGDEERDKADYAVRGVALDMNPQQARTLAEAIFCQIADDAWRDVATLLLTQLTTEQLRDLEAVAHDIVKDDRR